MSNEALSQLPHKLATLIRSLPQAPFRDHMAAECIKQAERIAEMESRVHTCGPTCSKAGCINRRLTTERDQLRAEVERLRADAERLDWIEHQYLEDLVMGLAVDCEHDGQYYVCGDDNKTGYGDSLRDAIDQARTTHKDEG